MSPPPITPDMKVGEFLAAFPALEDTLIAIAPEFGKLRNPILRRTVAKIATLEQAARIAGLEVRELVRRLRLAAGQSVELTDLATQADAFGQSHPAGDASRVETAPAGMAGASAFSATPPAWLDRSRIDAPLDADAVLRGGEHPLGLVRQRLRVLHPGQILCIVSSFRPVPLVDVLAREGYACFMAEEGGKVRTYVLQNRPAGADPSAGTV